MRKQFVIIELTQFDRVREAPPVVAERAAGDPRRPPGGIARRDRRENLEVVDPERYQLMQDIDIMICYGLADAEEYVDEALRRSPQHKYIITESIGLFETVPSPTIKKAWDNNGQLVERKN